MEESLSENIGSISVVPRSLVKKLAAVMAEVERVPKNGRNEFHKYDYATESDITAVVRKGMSARHLIWVPEVKDTKWLDTLTKSGGKERICTLTVVFRILDGESGESLTVGPILGEGQDSGDKATYKAMTGATKYALMKTFLIPTGDDPEAEAMPAPATTVNGAAALKAKLAIAPPPAPAAKPAAPPASPPRARMQIQDVAGPKHKDIEMKFGGGEGKRISQLSEKDLEWYLAAIQRSADNPEKANFREKNLAEVAIIRAELAYRKQT